MLLQDGPEVGGVVPHLVVGWIRGPWTLKENLDSNAGMLTFLGNLAYVGKTILLGLGVFLNDYDMAALGSGLEEGGDGQGDDGPVRVSDKVLQVKVTGGDGGWVGHGHIIQTPHSGKPQSEHVRGPEQLQHGHGGLQLLAGGPLHNDDSMILIRR